jgi:uncharacterized membrane protein
VLCNALRQELKTADPVHPFILSEPGFVRGGYAMLLAVLIVLNLPVYLLIGWLVFDTKDRAADTFFDTIIAILKAIFIPRIIRVLMGDDDDGAWGIFPIAGFLIACAFVVYAEYWLITACILQKG